MIEWADKIVDALPDDRIDLHLAFDGGDLRSLTVIAHGARSEALAAQWREAIG